MASLKIEGDIQGINNVRMEFLRGVIQNRGFNYNTVVIEPVGQVGDNYIANVVRVRVVVEDGKDFSMIAKFPPEEPATREAMQVALMFQNEIYMYEKLLPKLVNLQKATGVPEEDWLRHAECYGSSSDAPNEALVLEDLNESNFIMLDRFTTLTDDVVRMILKNFAILHSLSFVLKKVEPETYDEARNMLHDTWSILCTSEQFRKVMVQMEAGACATVDGKYKNAFRGVVAQAPDTIIKLAKMQAHSKNLVIQQGDAWTNNILFKMDGDKPQECIMIDYQISRESSPVSDILYMVFNCTDHGTREKHYLDWIDYYHRQLDESLSYFGMKANFVYPKDQLDADLKRYSKLYFGMSVMILTVMTRKPEEAKEAQEAMKSNDVEKMTGISLSQETMALYKSRLEGLVESYHLFGYM